MYFLLQTIDVHYPVHWLMAGIIAHQQAECRSPNINKNRIQCQYEIVTIVDDNTKTNVDIELR